MKHEFEIWVKKVAVFIAFFGAIALPFQVSALSTLNVPFITQAPTGNWAPSIYQNGCEEASLIMAIHWVRGTPLTAKRAAAEIKKLSMYETALFGTAVDSSVQDTARLMKEYYRHSAIRVKYEITKADIVRELSSGHLVIIPANGRALGNPHFKRPGPQTHMVVIKGYDAKTREFIANDSGTRFGNGYRYKEDSLLDAIRDYPTGNHLPIIGRRTALISIARR